MNQPLTFPNIEPRTDAAGIPAMRCLDRLFVAVVLYVARAAKVAAVVDVLDAVYGHPTRVHLAVGYDLNRC